MVVSSSGAACKLPRKHSWLQQFYLVRKTSCPSLPPIDVSSMTLSVKPHKAPDDKGHAGTAGQAGRPAGRTAEEALVWRQGRYVRVRPAAQERTLSLRASIQAPRLTGENDGFFLTSRRYEEIFRNHHGPSLPAGAAEDSCAAVVSSCPQYSRPQVADVTVQYLRRLNAHTADPKSVHTHTDPRRAHTHNADPRHVYTHTADLHNVHTHTADLHNVHTHTADPRHVYTHTADLHNVHTHTADLDSAYIHTAYPDNVCTHTADPVYVHTYTADPDSVYIHPAVKYVHTRTADTDDVYTHTTGPDSFDKHIADPDAVHTHSADPDSVHTHNAHPEHGTPQTNPILTRDQSIAATPSDPDHLNHNLTLTSTELQKAVLSDIVPWTGSLRPARQAGQCTVCTVTPSPRSWCCLLPAYLQNGAHIDLGHEECANLAQGFSMAEFATCFGAKNPQTSEVTCLGTNSVIQVKNTINKGVSSEATSFCTTNPSSSAADCFRAKKTSSSSSTSFRANTVSSSPAACYRTNNRTATQKARCRRKACCWVGATLHVDMTGLYSPFPLESGQHSDDEPFISHHDYTSEFCDSASTRSRYSEYVLNISGTDSLTALSVDSSSTSAEALSDKSLCRSVSTLSMIAMSEKESELPAETTQPLLLCSPTTNIPCSSELPMVSVSDNVSDCCRSTNADQVLQPPSTFENSSNFSLRARQCLSHSVRACSSDDTMMAESTAAIPKLCASHTAPSTYFHSSVNDKFCRPIHESCRPAQAVLPFDPCFCSLRGQPVISVIPLPLEHTHLQQATSSCHGPVGGGVGSQTAGGKEPASPKRAVGSSYRVRDKAPAKQLSLAARKERSLEVLRKAVSVPCEQPVMSAAEENLFIIRHMHLQHRSNHPNSGSRQAKDHSQTQAASCLARDAVVDNQPVLSSADSHRKPCPSDIRRSKPRRAQGARKWHRAFFNTKKTRTWKERAGRHWAWSGYETPMKSDSEFAIRGSPAGRVSSSTDCIDSPSPTSDCTSYHEPLSSCKLCPAEGRSLITTPGGDEACAAAARRDWRCSSGQSNTSSIVRPPSLVQLQGHKAGRHIQPTPKSLPPDTKSGTAGSTSRLGGRKWRKDVGLSTAIPSPRSDLPKYSSVNMGSVGSLSNSLLHQIMSVVHANASVPTAFNLAPPRAATRHTQALLTRRGQSGNGPVVSGARDLRALRSSRLHNLVCSRRDTGSLTPSNPQVTSALTLTSQRDHGPRSPQHPVRSTCVDNLLGQPPPHRKPRTSK